MSTFTAVDLENALDDLAVCRYFPADDRARAMVGRMLAEMVPSREALRWLTKAQVEVGVWYGPRELRGLLCSRFRPADGVEADCLETPGFRPSDLETKFVTEQDQEHERKMLEWKRQPKLIEGECPPITVRVKAIPKPTPAPAAPDVVRLAYDEAKLADELSNAPRLSDEERARAAKKLEEDVMERLGRYVAKSPLAQIER